MPDGCDIIDDEIKYSLFGKCKLPFSLSINYIPTYEIEEAEYTDDEIVRVASERMTALMTSRLASSDVVRLKTYGEFTAEGYMIRSEYTYIGNVGENAAFFIE